LGPPVVDTSTIFHAPSIELFFTVLCAMAIADASNKMIDTCKTLDISLLRL
jgi:hypothetical protein